MAASGLLCHARAGLTLLLMCAGIACAQSYPVKPVRYIVPMSPGSGADTIARIVSGGLNQAFGQQVLVDNRTGAAGNLGAEIAAKSPADGYTLFQASSSHAINVSIYRNLSYDLVRDFTPVTLLATSPSLLVVHPSVPAKSVGDLVKLAKARPGQLNYASTGSGSATFLAAELFKGMAGVNMLHVPYRGGGEAITSILSGETSVYFAPMAAALPLVQQGRIRALAVTTAARLPQVRELLTVAESGYRGYQAGNWYGIVVPAKTPRDIVMVIRSAAVKALNDPVIAKRMTDLGYISIGNQPEDFAGFIKSEIDSLGRIVRQTGITAN